MSSSRQDRDDMPRHWPFILTAGRFLNIPFPRTYPPFLRSLRYSKACNNEKPRCGHAPWFFASISVSAVGQHPQCPISPLRRRYSIGGSKGQSPPRHSRSKIPPSSALRAARIYLAVSSGSTLRRAAVAPSSIGQSRYPWSFTLMLPRPLVALARVAA